MAGIRNYWSHIPSSSFVTKYSGLIVVILKGQNGGYMRCQLRLIKATLGMEEGEQGRCQPHTGIYIDEILKSHNQYRKKVYCEQDVN